MAEYQDHLLPSAGEPSDPANQQLGSSPIELLVGELARCTSRIQALQATATTIIQLSILALAAGLAAFATLPSALALVPPLFSIWLFYLFAINRETVKHVAHRLWLEQMLNSLCDGRFRGHIRGNPVPNLFQWQKSIEFETENHTPWMLVGIYTLTITANLLAWAIAAAVLYFEMRCSDDPTLKDGAAWAVSTYVIIAGLVAAAFIQSWRSERRLATSLRDALGIGSFSAPTISDIQAPPLPVSDRVAGK